MATTEEAITITMTAVNVNNAFLWTLCVRTNKYYNQNFGVTFPESRSAQVTTKQKPGLFILQLKTVNKNMPEQLVPIFGCFVLGNFMIMACRQDKI